MQHPQKNNYEVILGNSNKRFSGVTSTMLQTLKHQKNIMPIRVLGGHHLTPEDRFLAVSFKQLKKQLKHPLPDSRPRIFHARRNDEMIQALCLKHLYGAKIKILFTSTAQRHHSRFTRFLMNKVDAVISTNQAAASYLKQPPKTIIAHGIETNEFYPDKTRDTSNIRIGIFGRVRKQKGIDIFVKAACSVLPKHLNATAHIIGEITSDNEAFARELKSEIDAAGLSDRIAFAGKLNFDEIPALYRSMDIICALSRNEGFGLTVLEAMSSGAAVLSSKAGAWPEIIQDGVFGYSVETANQRATNEALDKLLSNSETLKDMGQAGRAHILKHYRIEDEAKALCDFYKGLQNT